MYNRTARQIEEAPRSTRWFESKYEARIEDSKEYRQYVRQMPYYMWDGKKPYEIETQVVPMKAIHLTTDNLDRLMAEQERIDRLLDEQAYDKKILAMLRADERVRDANPTVQKAYQKYLMLLELARK